MDLLRIPEMLIGLKQVYFISTDWVKIAYFEQNVSLFTKKIILNISCKLFISFTAEFDSKVDRLFECCQKTGTALKKKLSKWKLANFFKYSFFRKPW